MRKQGNFILNCLFEEKNIDDATKLWYYGYEVTNVKDFPVFTTENGVASLVLREIPYKGIAFVTLQDTRDPRQLLSECVEFCRAVGAQRIFAAGHSILYDYPQAVSVIRMRCARTAIDETDAALFPVTEKTIDKFREIYNQKMADISVASTMTVADAEKLLQRGAGYFVHRGDELLGIGIVADDTIEAIAGMRPGVGADVLCALSSALYSDWVVLEVASTNIPAIRLYEKVGFFKLAEVICWHDATNL